jgi:hypothetical protein
MAFTASVITTKEWGAKPPLNAPFKRTVPKYVVIHHTFIPKNSSGGTVEGAKQTARDIQASHMGPRNFWSDSGHNFLNSKGGILLEGRHGSIAAARNGFSVQSAHALQDPPGLAGGNSSPGIENEGDFNEEVMEDEQWNSLVELCASLCSSCEIDPGNIRGHKDFSDTQCPGRWLYGQIGRLQDEVRAELGLQLPDPALATTLRFGSRGPDVIRLQERLRELGFNPGPGDGDFGDQTQSAVVNFQATSDLTEDGIVGPKTLEALGIQP